MSPGCGPKCAMCGPKCAHVWTQMCPCVDPNVPSVWTQMSPGVDPNVPSVWTQIYPVCGPKCPQVWTQIYSVCGPKCPQCVGPNVPRRNDRSLEGTRNIRVDIIIVISTGTRFISTAVGADKEMRLHVIVLFPSKYYMT